MTVLLRNARVVTPDTVLPTGYLVIENGVITAIGADPPSAPGGPAGTGPAGGSRFGAVAAGGATGGPTDGGANEPTDASGDGASESGGPAGGGGDGAGWEVVDLAGGTVLPGFVDIHTHGGGGATFTTGDVDDARRASAFHLEHGTTTLLASLVTSPPELMRQATEAYRPLVADGTIAGLHYEGPYLSHARCGAQNPEYLRDPDLAELDTLLGIGGVRMITIAPERDGALDAIRYLVDRGVVVAVGHTDASYGQVRAAVDAGATVGTHVFNGMRPPHHRDPGPVYALLANPPVTCEFIADGEHLDDGTLAFATSVTGPDRAALITDAMSAAGMADGAYELGGQAVTVTGGVARLAEGGSIAGSTLTMDAAVRRALGAGLSLVDVARMAATTPARTIGLTDRGALVTGARADLVVLDAELAVSRVMRGGCWQ